jgi:glutathione S-transferase
MTTLTLYSAPSTCAKVTTIVLEEIGAPYELELVRFMKGAHKSPDYKRLNPKGKVPTLLVDGESLTENPVIIHFLNERFPAAGIMPATDDPLEKARQLADLCFCSSTLHPIVTRIRMPHFFATPEAVRVVWEKSCAAMDEYFQLVEGRLSQGLWWYGQQWSAMDAYLYWIHWRVVVADYDSSRYPCFNDHARRMEERPAVKRALAREAQLQSILEAEGLVFTPPPLPAA